MQDYPIRNRTVRIPLDVTASRPPGRRQTWTVEAGQWRSEAATEPAAVAALTAGLREYLSQYQEPQVVFFRGHTAVVFLDLGTAPAVTWRQRVVKPSGAISHSSDAAGSWEAAGAAARYEIAQRTTDLHDDSSVREAAAYLAEGPKLPDGRHGPAELYHQAALQRAAKAAIDAGREDWSDWAHEHYAQFAIPASDTDGRCRPAVTG